MPVAVVSYENRSKKHPGLRAQSHEGSMKDSKSMRPTGKATAFEALENAATAASVRGCRAVSKSWVTRLQIAGSQCHQGCGIEVLEVQSNTHARSWAEKHKVLGTDTPCSKAPSSLHHPGSCLLLKQISASKR